MSAKDKHYDATMSYIEYIENGQLEEALEKLTKQRDAWKADAERGWYWAENLEGKLSESNFDSFIADLKEHKELKEKK